MMKIGASRQGILNMPLVCAYSSRKGGSGMLVSPICRLGPSASSSGGIASSSQNQRRVEGLRRSQIHAINVPTSATVTNTPSDGDDQIHHSLLIENSPPSGIPGRSSTVPGASVPLKRRIYGIGPKNHASGSA